MFIETNPPDCAACKARFYTVFAGCDKALLQIISNRKIQYYYSAGEAVFSEQENSDGVYCLYDGLVLLSKQSETDTDDVIIMEVVQGALLGIEGVVNNVRRQTTATATTNCWACYIPKEAIVECISQDARIATNVMQRLCSIIKVMGLRTDADKLFCE